MLAIGICDSDPDIIEELRNIIAESIQTVTDWQIRIYKNGEEVISSIKQGIFDCTLLFTDIFTDTNSGIIAARYIQEHEVDTDLIFVTSAKDYVFECYHYNTFAYLLKPLSRTDVKSELMRYLSEYHSTPKCLNIPIKGTTHRIPVNTILYLESDLRKVIVHTRYKDYDYYSKLGELEEMLREDGFIRCHQSYLVASDKITSYNVNELYIDDIKIPVSRKYQHDIRNLMETEAAAAAENSCFLTNSISLNQGKTGAFVCVQGMYLGSIIRIKPKQKILIGRDGSVSDMIVNLPAVSRTHCAVTYHADRSEYEIVDFSSNGTFVGEGFRLVKDEKYVLKPGTEVCFGDRSTVYKLG